MYNEHQKPYHIGFINEVGARYAILPGDPGRVEKIAAHLANPRFVAQNREYTTWVGEIEGEPVYLLSADRFLWGRALYAVDQDEIQFSEIHIHGVDLDGYVLFYMARDLYRGSQHISLSELIDPELVSDQVFERIVTACLIRRYGSVVLQEGLQ